MARLANSLGNELFKAEAAKGARSKNPDAVDLAMRGRAALWQAKTWDNGKDVKDQNDAAIALFEQALKIDPDDADALAGEALAYANEYSWERTNSRDYEAKILDQADRAIALAPDNMWAYWAKSWYLFIAGRWNDALRAADAGLAINPNFAPRYGARGFAENGLGRFEQAKSYAQQAMRLSPRDLYIQHWRLVLGDAETELGHFDAAIEEYHKIDGDYLDLAAAYALAGNMEEAKSALAEARRREPEFTVKWLIKRLPHLPRWFEGIRKAGLPEG